MPSTLRARDNPGEPQISTGGAGSQTSPSALTLWEGHVCGRAERGNHGSYFIGGGGTGRPRDGRGREAGCLGFHFLLLQRRTTNFALVSTWKVSFFLAARCVRTCARACVAAKRRRRRCAIVALLRNSPERKAETLYRFLAHYCPDCITVSSCPAAQMMCWNPGRAADAKRCAPSSDIIAGERFNQRPG